jgi:hypothetical protein
MATNRDLLKEAIADAKAVKETAIANAKAALEEAFTPQLQSMFSMKLQEMEDSDLEDATKRAEKGDSTDLALHMAGIKEDDNMNDEIDLEELLRELEEEEEVEESLNEAEEEEAEDVEMSDEESEEGEEEGEPLDLEDMTDEDLKDIIEDVIKDMIASGELEAGEEGEAEEGEEEVGVEDEEEIDLAELLKEIEEMEEPVEEGFIDTVKKAAQNLLKGSEQKWLEKQIESGKYNDELAAIEAAEDTIDAKRRATTGIDETMKDELAEAMKTIEALKSELNEINLLNAKLLYTNKIFKSKNLNENQKVKVLSSFDKATTVGEVKMVFETLNEGIKVKKETIKENLGRASKATVTPVTKQPIVESNDAFLRMQKLAGII